MLKEFATSIKAILYDRVSSPLGGVLILSWLTFNWKLPIILFFGDEKYITRIQHISEYLKCNQDKLLLYPVISAGIILLLYPIISLIPFYWWHFWSNLRVKLKQKIEGKALLTIEQSLELKSQIDDVENKYHKLINDSSSGKKALERRVSQLVEENIALNREFDHLQEESWELQDNNYKLHREDLSISPGDDQPIRTSHEILNKEGISIPKEIIPVSSPSHFAEAIGSNRVIILDDPELLLEEVKFNVKNDAVLVEESFNGKNLIIKNVENLSIISLFPQHARLLVTPTYSNVLTLDNCQNIFFYNIEMGHEPKGECTGGVLKLNSCENIVISNSVLFGCGTEGLTVENSSNITFKSSIIKECTYGIMTINDSRNITFEGSKFERNRQFDLISVSNSSDILFTECSIFNNETSLSTSSEKQGYSLFSIENDSSVIVQDSKIYNNKSVAFARYNNEKSLKLVNTKEFNNTFTKKYFYSD